MSGAVDTVKNASMMKNIGGATALGGSILSGLSSYQNSRTQASQLSSDASQLRDQGKAVYAQAGQQAQQQTSQARQAESTSLATAAASGANANSVSAVNNRADIAQKGELNSLTTLWNGEQQMNNMDNQANALDAQAKATKKAGGLGILSSILGAGTSLAKIYG